MKLTQITHSDRDITILQTERGWLNLTALREDKELPLPLSVEDFAKQADSYLGEIEAVLSTLDELAAHYFLHCEEDFSFAPLFVNPSKVIAVGLNYREHIAETNLQHSSRPELFIKTSNTLNFHQNPIKLIPEASHYDYEGELLVVIGREAKSLTPEQAEKAILGYSIGNDFTARDLQFQTSQWLLGKFLDGFAPIGPYLVTKDQLDLTSANIETKWNGKTVQQAQLTQMIYSPAQIVSYLSQYMTLSPGDLIFTGTPSGVILGENESKYPWVKSGDQIEISITSLGTLQNTVL